jgi:hypothetical protein
MIIKLPFLRLAARLTLVILIAAVLLGASTLRATQFSDEVRAYTRQIEFDYLAWMFDAMRLKIQQEALNSAAYIPPETRQEVVYEYLQLVREIQGLEAQLDQIYGDPQITDPDAASAGQREELEQRLRRRDQIQPLAEATLQRQVAQVAAGMNLTLGGQPIPPVLYHSTPLPLALIVSPREVIRQDANISLHPGLTIEEIVHLEERVEAGLGVSSLVVNIGGVGVYPTMVQQSSNLNWLSEVVAHEWIHNWLSLRPLGVSYLNTPELRTMNETTATIAGKEIGEEVIRRFYPELAPPPPPPPALVTDPEEPPPPPPEPPEFDFYVEMGRTRVEADRLLAEGKVDEAEAYLEQRRIMFWERGYRFRKLNQAYFAFHGAYADRPGGGAAGEDPVGAAVRALRSQSDSLAEFLRRIAWMSSFEELQRAVDEDPT